MIQNVISFCGMFVLILVAWSISEDRRRFPWRVVTWGLALQMLFGFLVLRWEPGARFFLGLNDVFNALLSFSREGAVFVFNSVGTSESGGGVISLKDYLTRLGAESHDPVIQAAVRSGAVPGAFFAFQVLTTIIFFSALLSVLYYLGVMQKIVVLFARIMARTMGVSGAESLSNSANIFVGQTEAPLVVRPYIEKMTRSELMAIMVGGFANTAGGVLGAYVMMLSGYFPNIASHLIAASLLSAPAAFIFAKVMVPEKEQPMTRGDMKHGRGDPGREPDRRGFERHHGRLAARDQRAAMLDVLRGPRGHGQPGFSWFGGFFRDGHGLLLFDLMAVAALASLLFVEKRRADATRGVAGLLGAIFALVLALKLVGRGVGPHVTIVGIAAWLPSSSSRAATKATGGAGGERSRRSPWSPTWPTPLFGPLAPGSDLSLQVSSAGCTGRWPSSWACPRRTACSWASSWARSWCSPSSPPTSTSRTSWAPRAAARSRPSTRAPR